MKYYYVATVGGDIIYSSPSLERVGEALNKWEQMYPSYIRNNRVQILCYEAREIIEWQPKRKTHYTDTK